MTQAIKQLRFDKYLSPRVASILHACIYSMHVYNIYMLWPTLNKELGDHKVEFLQWNIKQQKQE